MQHTYTQKYKKVAIKVHGMQIRMWNSLESQLGEPATIVRKKINNSFEKIADTLQTATD